MRSFDVYATDPMTWCVTSNERITFSGSFWHNFDYPHNGDIPVRLPQTNLRLIASASGPLVKSIGGRTTTIGIVSFGAGCGSFPGVYTSVVQYRDWIAANIY